MRHETAGDPMTGLKWTRRTTEKIAEELKAVGIDVSANFTTYRTKDGNTDLLFGQAMYRLRMLDGQMRIRSKRCLLDTDGLRPFGRISIIL